RVEAFAEVGVAGDELAVPRYQRRHLACRSTVWATAPPELHRHVYEFGAAPAADRVPLPLDLEAVPAASAVRPRRPEVVEQSPRSNSSSARSERSCGSGSITRPDSIGGVLLSQRCRTVTRTGHRRHPVRPAGGGTARQVGSARTTAW